MRRKKAAKAVKKNGKIDELNVINPKAAGIDIGSGEHWVCVPESSSKDNIRKFGTFTFALLEMANWLSECGVTTVAMESTGIYWIPLYEVLESRGFEVNLCNAKHAKNVPGRAKTDRCDCSWLKKLHTYGLLSASFIPPANIRELKSLMRHRENLVRESSRHIQHMQKALTSMNVLLHKVVKDITGKTGMQIIRAILGGDTNPRELVKYRHPSIKASDEEVVQALEGNYRFEHLFILKQAVESYDFVIKQIAEFDSCIDILLSQMDKKEDNKKNPVPKTKRPANVSYSSQVLLYEIFGVDLLQIPGLSALSIRKLIGEIGLDMNRWKNSKYFTSWLGLSPNRKISGGKVLSEKTNKVQSRAACIFRMSASTLWKSNTYLGGFLRRKKSQIGSAKALTATARKIAVIVYTMVKEKVSYQELGAEYYEQKYKDRSVKRLLRQAKRLGFSLNPLEVAKV